MYADIARTSASMPHLQQRISQDLIWEKGGTYMPGDLVTAKDSNGKEIDAKFQCKWAPYGDFCSVYDPVSYMGAIAWREYLGTEDDQLPLQPRESIDCVPLEQAADIQFEAEDTVCEGEKYVWKCRQVSANDWCNMHLPNTEYGYLAWELLAGLPHIVEEDIIIAEREAKPYVERSDAELLRSMNEIELEDGMSEHLQPIILNMSLEEFWNAFYDDSAPFFVADIVADNGDQVNGFTYWQEPPELDYLTSAYKRPTVSWRKYDAKLLLGLIRI